MAADLDRLVETAVRSALDPVTVESVAIEHRWDSMDEEALHVVVTLPTGTPLVGGKRYIGAMTAVSDALIALGEQRFPDVRLNRAGRGGFGRRRPPRDACPMTPDDLIDLARELARREAGRPKSVSLRRSASSACYAVFHALAYLCADQLVGWRRPYGVFTPIYQSLDHSKARAVLNASRQRASRDPSIEAIAVPYATLQDARHDADHNPEPFPFSRTGTLELIDSAERAIVAVRSLPLDENLALAVKLVVKSR